MRFLSFEILTCSQKSWALMQTALNVHVAELENRAERQEFHCKQKNSFMLFLFLTHIYVQFVVSEVFLQ